MTTKKLQESQKLLDSVREHFNRTDGIDRDEEIVEYSLGADKQAFVEKFSVGSSLLDPSVKENTITCIL